MSHRSRLARQVAREVIEGQARFDIAESGRVAPGRYSREEFREWLRIVQGCWGSPRSWRKGRRAAGHRIKRREAR